MSSILTESMSLSTVNLGSGSKKGVVSLYFFIDNIPFIVENRAKSPTVVDMVVSLAKSGSDATISPETSDKVYYSSYNNTLSDTISNLINKKLAGSTTKVNLIINNAKPDTLDKLYYELGKSIKYYYPLMIHGNKNYGLMISQNPDPDFDLSKKEIDKINPNVSAIKLSEFPTRCDISAYNTNSIENAISANAIINRVPPINYDEKLGMGRDSDFTRETSPFTIKIEDTFYPYFKSKPDYETMDILLDKVGTSLCEPFKNIFIKRFEGLFKTYYESIGEELTVEKIEGFINDFVLYVNSFNGDDFSDLENFIFIKLCHTLNVFIERMFRLISSMDNDRFSLSGTDYNFINERINIINCYLKSYIKTGDIEAKGIEQEIKLMDQIMFGYSRDPRKPYPYLYRRETVEYNDLERFINNKKYVNLNYMNFKPITNLRNGQLVRKGYNPMNNNPLQGIALDEKGNPCCEVDHLLILDPYGTVKLGYNTNESLIDRGYDFNYINLGSDNRFSYAVISNNPLLTSDPTKPTDIINKNRYLSKFVSFARYINTLTLLYDIE